MSTSKNIRIETFIKTEGHWFPITNDMIDKRGSGHASKKAVKEWAADRMANTDEKITVKFRS